MPCFFGLNPKALQSGFASVQLVIHMHAKCLSSRAYGDINRVMDVSELNDIQCHRPLGWFLEAWRRMMRSATFRLDQQQRRQQSRARLPVSLC
jgi:hypothetical protein